jgi:transposase
MLRTYRYRLYTTNNQQDALDEILWVACWLYNRALNYRRKRWNESRKSVRYTEQAGMWREWRNEAGDNSLRMLNMSAGQQVLRRLDSAYRQFLKGERGRPRFQKSSRFNSLIYKPGDGASIKNNRLYVQNVGLVRVGWHRALPGGKLKNIVIGRKPPGWYVLLQIDIFPQPVEKSTKTEAGCEIVTVNPRNTSQACSGCGSILLKDLSVRLHVCHDCGLTLDRDVDAARNILALGHRGWALTYPVGESVAQEAARL